MITPIPTPAACDVQNKLEIFAAEQDSVFWSPLNWRLFTEKLRCTSITAPHSLHNLNLGRRPIIQPIGANVQSVVLLDFFHFPLRQQHAPHLSQAHANTPPSAS